MLMILTLPLIGTVVLACIKDIGTELNQIIMIAMAAFAFAKITVATIDLVRARKSLSAKLITLRNVSFSDACVSIFTLQRSMLITFDGMNESEIFVMNGVTGLAVCTVVFLLGFNLVRNKKILFDNI